MRSPLVLLPSLESQGYQVEVRLFPFQQVLGQDDRLLGEEELSKICFYVIGGGDFC
jgi:hypothetical protein